jgi:hypothetical protein
MAAFLVSVGGFAWRLGVCAFAASAAPLVLTITLPPDELEALRIASCFTNATTTAS